MTRLSQLVRTWEFFLFVLVVLVLVLASATVPGFTDQFSLSTAMAAFAPAALMALPLALLVVTRDIDISISSMAALTSVAAGLAIQRGLSLPAVILVSLLTGLVCGAINGFFCVVLELPALLVTLGTMALFRGLCYVFLGGAPISPVPDFFISLGNDNLPGTFIPYAIVPFLVLAVVFGLVLHRTYVGRRIYAIGGNPDTARYSGIRNNHIRFALFVLSGVVCAVAGMINMGITSQVAPDAALGIELDSITVVFLGGVSVLGGKGKITGVLWATVLIMALRKYLQLQNVSGYTQGIAIGGVLIASLLVTNVSGRISEAIRRRRDSAEAAGSTA